MTYIFFGCCFFYILPYFATKGFLKCGLVFFFSVLRFGAKFALPTNTRVHFFGMKIMSFLETKKKKKMGWWFVVFVVLFLLVFAATKIRYDFTFVQSKRERFIRYPPSCEETIVKKFMDGKLIISVIGVYASGKSFLSKSLSKSLQMCRVDLDEINHLPNWKVRSSESFCIEVQRLLSHEAHGRCGGVIIDGNYSKALRIVWPNSHLILWLDYEACVNWIRLIRRSIVRLCKKEKICGGNVESMDRLVSWNDDSLFYRLWSRHSKNRKKYKRRLFEDEFQAENAMVLRFCSPADLNEWKTKFISTLQNCEG